MATDLGPVRATCKKKIYGIYIINEFHYKFISFSFHVNEQLMIKVQKMSKVTERARPFIQRRLVNVTRPDKWSHNK